MLKKNLYDVTSCLLLLGELFMDEEGNDTHEELYGAVLEALITDKDGAKKVADVIKNGIAIRAMALQQTPPEGWNDIADRPLPEGWHVEINPLAYQEGQDNYVYWKDGYRKHTAPTRLAAGMGIAAMEYGVMSMIEEPGKEPH